MLAVVLSILKFVGITILILLGVLLVVICLVLFVPVRYKAEGFYKDTYRIQARLSWLLHAVSFALLYEKDQPFQMKLRILGIPVYDNLHKKEAVKKHKSRSKEKASSKEDYIPEEYSKEETPEIMASSIEEKQDAFPVKARENALSQSNQDSTKKKLSIWQKIKQIFSKIISFFQNIKYTFQKMYDTMKNVKDNITYYTELFQKASTQAAILTCKKQLIRIIKNLKPQKFQLNLHIGMEDPAAMGDILGIWGMLYPLHEGHIDICPDFERTVFEGAFYCKGRVTVYIYLWTLMIILFDKDIKHLKKCLIQEGK